MDLTRPATEKHISKARAQQFVMVRETPSAYAEATLPYIRNIPDARLGWVRNILNKSVSALEPASDCARSRAGSAYCD